MKKLPSRLMAFQLQGCADPDANMEWNASSRDMGEMVDILHEYKPKSVLVGEFRVDVAAVLTSEGFKEDDLIDNLWVKSEGP